MIDRKDDSEHKGHHVNRESHGTRSSFLIIGNNSICAELVPQLPQNSHVTIIDVQVDEKREEKIIGLADDRTVKFVIGDASSALILEKAGIQSADWLISLIRDDAANQEICEIAKERYKKKDIVVLVQSDTIRKQLQDNGIHSVFENRSIALSVKSIIFPGKQIAQGIGLDAGELMEVLVLPSSPIIGIPLQVLKPKNWLIAALYRYGELLIPHGDTTIQAGDKILIVGAPDVLPLIADFVHRGQPGFPLSFGSEVLIIDTTEGDNTIIREGCSLLNLTRSVGGLVLTENVSGEMCSSEIPDGCCKKLDFREFSGPVNRELSKKEYKGRFGLVVVTPRTKLNFFKHYLMSVPLWEEDILRLFGSPLLIARNSEPYRRILVCLSPTVDPLMLSTSAVELSVLLNAELTAITVTPPDLVIGKGEHLNQTEVLRHFKMIAGAYGLVPASQPVIGNPVREIQKVAAEFDLVLISHDVTKKVRVLKPDVSRLLMLTIPTTTLVIPHEMDKQFQWDWVVKGNEP